jgi:TPR repeat protein
VNPVTSDRRPVTPAPAFFLALAALVSAALLAPSPLTAQGGGRDIDQAFVEELESAYALGDAEAAFALGALSYFGHERVPRNLAKAVECLELAAGKGHVMAMSLLAELYETGTGVGKDEKKAVKLYTKAADKGDPMALLALGRLYYSGSETVKADKKRAFRYYTLAAEQNQAEAQLVLGGMYEQGEGTEKDPGKSWQYFLLAAENPGDNGQGALAAGDVYVSGRNPDVPQDLEKGREYYRKAAAKNVPEAKERLALLDRAKSPKK